MLKIIFMEFADIKNTPVKELKTMLGTERDALRTARFELSSRSLKNTQSISALRKTIARILTVLNEKKAETK